MIQPQNIVRSKQFEPAATHASDSSIMSPGGDRNQDSEDYSGEVPGSTANACDLPGQDSHCTCTCHLQQDLGLNEKIQFANRKAVGAGGKRQLVARSSLSLADRNETSFKWQQRYRRPQKRTRMSGSLWRKRKQLMLASVSEVPLKQTVAVCCYEAQEEREHPDNGETRRAPGSAEKKPPCLLGIGIALGNLAMLCRIRVKQIIDIAWKEPGAQLCFLTPSGLQLTTGCRDQGMCLAGRKLSPKASPCCQQT